VSVLNPGIEHAQFVTTLQSDGSPDQEIVIIDGGSKVDSIREAEGSGRRVISSPRGRGNQITAGVAASTAPWILIAHVDIQPRAGWREDLAIAAHQHPGAAMFVFGYGLCYENFDFPRYKFHPVGFRRCGGDHRRPNRGF
jgi:GT2 family glycosyltransferase